MPDQVSFAKGSTKPTSGITTGRLYVVDSSTTDKSDLYLGKDATHLIQIGATVAQGAKADSSVQSVKVGSTSYSPSSGVVSLPAYPTTLPASDVYAWAKAATKPSYTFSEITSRGEEYLEWGPKTEYKRGGVSPVGMAISNEHSANRFAFLNPAAVSIEYTEDGGTTWVDSGYTDAAKLYLVTSSYNIAVGKPGATPTTSMKTRITIAGCDGTNEYVYTNLKKLLINMSVPNAVELLVEYRQGNESINNWHTWNTYQVSGWSGWNDIPYMNILGGATSQTSNVWYLRLTFSLTEVRENVSYYVIGLRGYGDSDWRSASSRYGKGPISSTGHLYSFDISANATFPAGVSATSFTENGTALSSKYLALTGGSMTGTLTVRAPIFGYEYNVSSNNAAFILDKPGANLTGIGSHAETDTIYFGACSAAGAWVDSYKQKWKFNGTIIEDGTALADKYLALTGGTMTGVINTTPNTKSIEFRSNNSAYFTSVAYETNGDEALLFKTKSDVTSFIFANGVTSSTANNEWVNVTPGLQVKNNKVAISKLIATGVTPTYNLDVNGTANATTLYENGTALSSKYGQLSAVNTWTSTQGIKTTSVPALELKNTSSSGGAFIDYENNNQTTNYWRSGMASSGTFAFLYNGTSKVEISTSGGITANGDVILYTASGDSPRVTFQRGTLTDTQNDWSIYDSGGNLHIQQRGSGSTAWEDRAYFTQSTVNFAGSILENGVSLANKYGRLASANTWTGVNTFNASDFYVTATNDISISGNSGQNIISTDNGTDVIVGDTTTDTTYIYGGVVDLNSSAVNIGYSSNGNVSINGATTVTGSISWASDPSNNNELTRKSYVDNKFVDKTSNQTGIAGNKTWTGNQTWQGVLSHGCTVSSPSSNVYSASGYYSAQNSTGSYSSTSSEIRTPQSLSLSSYGNRENSDYSAYDYSGASCYISNGWVTGFSDLCKPRIGFSISSEGQNTGGSYVYYYGNIELFSSGIADNQKYFRVSHSTNADEVQNSLTYNANGRFSLDYDYMWGEETAHMEIFPQNGDYYIGDPNTYGTVSLSDIVNAITCFRGDTTYVTMYDGTKKLISEVKEGDSVLGYDVNKKDYCEAIVIKNIKTGEQMGYNCYVMDDGTTIDIHGDDNFIANVKDKWYCDSDGDYLGIYSMTKNLMKFHDTGDDSHRIIKETGNLDNTTCVIHTFWTPCAEMTPRYSLYTSNGTMFVNGLLHAQSPRDTINIFRKRRFTLPDNIKEVFDEISVDMSARDEALPNDRISNPEKAENIAKLNEAKVKIAVYKKKLADTDYKAMKYAEGALTEEEWLPVKEDRASWRNTVNQMEEVVAEYQPIVEEENPEMFEHDWQYKNSKWKYRQSIFDAHLEDFREWQENIKEERQKRIEESKERSRLRAEEIKANKSSQKNEDK